MITKTIAQQILPKLKTGDVLISPQGFEYIVHQITGKRARATSEYEEPLYQLERTIKCNGIYTLDRLAALGLTLKEK
jgi:hypothetical protein